MGLGDLLSSQLLLGHRKIFFDGYSIGENSLKFTVLLLELSRQHFIETLVHQHLSAKTVNLLLNASTLALPVIESFLEVCHCILH